MARDQNPILELIQQLHREGYYFEATIDDKRRPTKFTIIFKKPGAKTKTETIAHDDPTELLAWYWLAKGWRACEHEKIMAEKAKNKAKAKAAKKKPHRKST